MHEERMEEVVREESLERDLGTGAASGPRQPGRGNGGAAGIDKRSTAKLEPHFRRHGAEIRAKLASGRWTPSPLRRAGPSG
jgi:hypothetical protein